MNAVEHIVESYFRYCKHCFTISDVKVAGGNNRQFDLLAYDVLNDHQYHVESSVTHHAGWQPSLSDLTAWFDKKFRGVPPRREGKSTDHAKGKSYLENINRAYKKYGFDPDRLNRVFVIWSITDTGAMQNTLASYAEAHKFRIDVISMRDTVIPQLMTEISTSNYDDEALRTISLLRQRELQLGNSTTSP